MKKEPKQSININTGDIARAEAFPKGNPIVYMENGEIVYEFPDGRIVKKDELNKDRKKFRKELEERRKECELK
jgi:hypothetical protein